MQAKRVNKYLSISILLIIIAFFITHLSPVLALRTKLFFSGYFDIALSSVIIPLKKENVEGRLFSVSPPPHEKATNSDLETYQVEDTFGIFYWAEYYGEI